MTADSVHDHYRVLLDAVAASLPSPEGTEPLSLDYDKRSRAPPLETSAQSALAEFEGTQQRIRNLFVGDSSAAKNALDRGLDRSIQLTATTPAEVEVGSTLGREVSESSIPVANCILIRHDAWRATRLSSLCRCGSSASMPSTTLRWPG